MCGIFGTTRRYERSVVEHKLELMNFRGPDHTGVEEILTRWREVDIRTCASLNHRPRSSQQPTVCV